MSKEIMIDQLNTLNNEDVILFFKYGRLEGKLEVQKPNIYCIETVCTTLNFYIEDVEDIEEFEDGTPVITIA